MTKSNHSPMKKFAQTRTPNLKNKGGGLSPPTLVATHSIEQEVKPHYADLEPSINLGVRKKINPLVGRTPQRCLIKL